MVEEAEEEEGVAEVEGVVEGAALSNCNRRSVGNYHQTMFSYVAG